MSSTNRDNEKLLSWRDRIKTAKGVSNAISYLHSAFATRIIYRNLIPSKVIVDNDGTPKLFDFSLSIQLPPGKLLVEDVAMGTWGFVDPEYLESGIVTEKTDVYSLQLWCASACDFAHNDGIRHCYSQ